jgi:hypothetical protein
MVSAGECRTVHRLLTKRFAPISAPQAVPLSVCALADRLQIFRVAENSFADSLKQLGLGAKDLGNRRGQGPPEELG